MISKRETEALLKRLPKFDEDETYPVGTLFVLNGKDYITTGYAELWVDEMMPDGTAHTLCAYWASGKNVQSVWGMSELGDNDTLVVLPGTPEHDLITAYAMWRAMRCDA